MKLIPRLPLATARELAEERAGGDWQHLMRLSSATHPRAYWSPTGVRPTEDEIRRLQRRVNEIMTESMSRGTLQGNRHFDVMAARVLRAELDLTASEASHPGGWSFVGCVLLPHVVRWRFPGQLGEPTPTHRLLGSGRGVRNALGRLWWRAEVLKDHDAGDPYHLLDELSEDELVGITERPMLAGHRRLALFFALAISGLEIGPERQAISRDASKRIRRASAILELRGLPDEGVRSFVARVMEESLRALDLVGIAPSAHKADEIQATYDSRPVVFMKVLSPNDVGATGSHQSAVVVPADDASRIAVLDEYAENPSAVFPVMSEDENTVWTWRLIHYNGRVHGHSTRDEYRLTGVTDFMERHHASVGDVLLMTKDRNGVLRARLDGATRS